MFRNPNEDVLVAPSPGINIELGILWIHTNHLQKPLHGIGLQHSSNQVIRHSKGRYIVPWMEQRECQSY